MLRGGRGRSYARGIQYCKGRRASALLAYAVSTGEEIIVECTGFKKIVAKVIKFDEEFSLWLQNAVEHSVQPGERAPRDLGNRLCMGSEVISVGLPRHTDHQPDDSTATASSP